MKIYSPAELETLFRAIVEDVRMATYQTALYRDLRNSVKGREMEFNLTPYFWNVTFNALSMAGISALCRVYDSHKEGINLLTLLRGLKSCGNTGWIAPNESASAYSLPTESEIDADISTVERSDDLVKRLKWNRDNLLAHKNRQHQMNGGVIAERFKLTYGDIDQLLERADVLLNKYSPILTGTTWIIEMDGKDDFIKLIDGAKLWLDDYRDNHGPLIRRTDWRKAPTD